MNLNDYQKAQIISVILAAQVITNEHGVINVEYVSDEQLDELESVFSKYLKVPLEEQILSIKDIVKQLISDLTKE